MLHYHRTRRIRRTFRFQRARELCRVLLAHMRSPAHRSRAFLRRAHPPQSTRPYHKPTRTPHSLCRCRPAPSRVPLPVSTVSTTVGPAVLQAHPSLPQSVLPLQQYTSAPIVQFPDTVVAPALPLQPAAHSVAQPAAFAADLDEKNSYTMLKLSNLARFTEASNNKIRRFIADLEYYLQMCARFAHHWCYFLLASLGTKEAGKVRRSHVAEVVADYATFKKGVKTLFGKFEFEVSYRAMLRSHAQAGAELIAA